MKEQILQLLRDEDVRAEILSILHELSADKVFVIQPMNAAQIGRLGFDMRNAKLDREIERGDERRRRTADRQIYNFNDKL